MMGSPLRYGPGEESPGPLVIRETSSCRSTIGVGVGIALFLAGTPVMAQEIHVDGGSCTSSVHLVAHNAPLADVLKRLAQTLDFRLRFESESNPNVTVDAQGTAAELVARLAPGNVSMTQARNPSCPKRERIVDVWVLPNSLGGPTRVAATPPQGRQTPQEQTRKDREGIDLILKSHGVALAQPGQTEPTQ